MRKLLTILCLALPAGLAWSQAAPRLPAGGIPLVSAAEALEFGGAAGFDEPRPLVHRAPTPQIEILRPEPTPDLKVKAPFEISVQFRALTDAPIDPASFKVLYGALMLDITSRITQYVQVTPTGFSFANARIPAGKHRLTLRIQDEKKRVAERELRVEVE